MDLLKEWLWGLLLFLIPGIMIATSQYLQERARKQARQKIRK